MQLSLQALVDAATGPTLSVPAGHHSGPLRLITPITLECADGVVLAGSIHIDADVSIQGLELHPPDGDTPAIVVESGNVSLQGCTIQGGGGIGLLVRGESRVEMQDGVIVSGPGVGAEVTGTAQLTLVDTAIRERGDDLLVVSEKAHCEARGCTFEQSGAASVWVRHTGDFRAHLCKLLKSPNGAQIEGEGAKVAFHKCTLRDTVWICDGAHGELVDCELRGPNEYLVVSQTAETSVSRCRLRGGTIAGAQAQRGGSIRLVGCDITENKHAVLVLDRCKAEVVDCVIHHNFVGVKVEGSADARVERCQLHHHEDAAIAVHQRAHAALVDVDISDEALGLGLVDQCHPVLEQVVVRGDISVGYVAMLPGVRAEVRSLTMERSVFTPETATERLVEYVDLQPARPDRAYLALAAGGDPNAQGREGITALMRAASRGEVELVRALIRAGGAPYQTDHASRNAIDWARAPDHFDLLLETDAALAAREEKQERVLCALGDCEHHAAPATPTRIVIQPDPEEGKRAAPSVLMAALWKVLANHLDARLTAACRPAADACWGPAIHAAHLDSWEASAEHVSFAIDAKVEPEARRLGEHWLEVALAGSWRNELAPAARRCGYRLLGRPELHRLWLRNDAPAWVEVDGAMVTPREDESRGIPEEQDIARAVARHGVCGCPVCGDNGCGLVRNLRAVAGFTLPPPGHRWVQACFWSTDGVLDAVRVERRFESREQAEDVVRLRDDAEQQNPRGVERTGYRVVLEHGGELFQADGSPFTGR